MIRSLVASEDYSEFRDLVVLLESSFAEVTRNGTGVKQVNLAITPEHLVTAAVVIRDDDELELESVILLDWAHISVHSQRNHRLRIRFCNGAVRYYELSERDNPEALWWSWCDRLSFINSDLTSSTASESSIVNDDDCDCDEQPPALRPSAGSHSLRTLRTSQERLSLPRRSASSCLLRDGGGSDVIPDYDSGDECDDAADEIGVAFNPRLLDRLLLGLRTRRGDELGKPRPAATPRHRPTAPHCHTIARFASGVSERCQNRLTLGEFNLPKAASEETLGDQLPLGRVSPSPVYVCSSPFESLDNVLKRIDPDWYKPADERKKSDDVAAGTPGLPSGRKKSEALAVVVVAADENSPEPTPYFSAGCCERFSSDAVEEVVTGDTTTSPPRERCRSGADTGARRRTTRSSNVQQAEGEDCRRRNNARSQSDTEKLQSFWRNLDLGPNRRPVSSTDARERDEKTRRERPADLVTPAAAGSRLLETTTTRTKLRDVCGGRVRPTYASRVNAYDDDGCLKEIRKSRDFVVIGGGEATSRPKKDAAKCSLSKAALQSSPAARQCRGSGTPAAAGFWTRRLQFASDTYYLDERRRRSPDDDVDRETNSNLGRRCALFSTALSSGKRDGTADDGSDASVRLVAAETTAALSDDDAIARWLRTKKVCRHPPRVDKAAEDAAAELAKAAALFDVLVEEGVAVWEEALRRNDSTSVVYNLGFVTPYPLTLCGLAEVQAHSGKLNRIRRVRSDLCVWHLGQRTCGVDFTPISKEKLLRTSSAPSFLLSVQMCCSSRNCSASAAAKEDRQEWFFPSFPKPQTPVDFWCLPLPLSFCEDDLWSDLTQHRIVTAYRKCLREYLEFVRHQSLRLPKTCEEMEREALELCVIEKFLLLPGGSAACNARMLDDSKFAFCSQRCWKVNRRSSSPLKRACEWVPFLRRSKCCRRPDLTEAHRATPFAVAHHHPETRTTSNLNDYSSRKLAVELTLVDKTLVCHVTTREMHHVVHGNYSTQDRAVRVKAVVAWFDRVVNLFTTEILIEREVENRAALVVKCIQVAKYMFRIRSYHSARAVLACLQSPPIFRLRRTWWMVSETHPNCFRQFCNMCRHFLDAACSSTLYKTNLLKPYLLFWGETISLFLGFLGCVEFEPDDDIAGVPPIRKLPNLSDRPPSATAVTLTSPPINFDNVCCSLPTKPPIDATSPRTRDRRLVPSPPCADLAQLLHHLREVTRLYDLRGDAAVRNFLLDEPYFPPEKNFVVSVLREPAREVYTTTDWCSPIYTSPPRQPPHACAGHDNNNPSRSVDE